MRISDWSSDVCSSDLLINPDVVRQQIESGLIFGMATALGATTGFTDNLADARGFGDLGLPLLADTPDITVELIRSEADPGGVGELGVPAVAPAIANAIQAATRSEEHTHEIQSIMPTQYAVSGSH